MSDPSANAPTNDPQPDPEPPKEPDWKAEARKWEERAKANYAAAKERDQLKAAQMTEVEKATAEAYEKGKTEATSEVTSRLLRTEIRAEAKGRLRNPDLAFRLLDDHDRFIADGDVDAKAVAKAIDQLLKDMPELAASPAGAGSGDGGARGRSKGVDMNQLIRDRMRSR
jgi:hypothetical protein